MTNDRTAEAEAWKNFVNSAKAWSQYMDQFNMIKFETEYGTVYVNIGRYSEYPDSFDEI